jgi:hypothetical protein
MATKPLRGSCRVAIVGADPSSLPPSRGQKGTSRSRALRAWRRARRGRPGTRESLGPRRSAADPADHNTDQSVPRRCGGFTFDIGEIGLFRNDSGTARTTAQQEDTDRSVGRGRRQRCVPDRAAQPLPTADARVGPTPVSPAGSRRAAPPAVIPAAAFMAPGIKPVIRARGAGAEPSAGSSEAVRCCAAGVPAAMSEAPPSRPPRASANPGSATATNIANALNINRCFMRLKRL